MPKVQDVMTRSVRTIPPDLDTAAARHLMRTGRFHHLIVVDRDRVVGVISQRDLGGTQEIMPAGRVDGVMRSSVITIGPELSLRAAARLLRGHNIGCLPVVDGKELVGILTTSDLLDWIGRDHDRARTTPGGRSKPPKRAPASV